MALVLAAAGPGSAYPHAQDTIRPVAAVPTVPASRPESRDAAQPVSLPGKSLPQRIFDTPWVLFPTRFAVVIVLLAFAALCLVSGVWGAVRFAHLLRHLEWGEPPRRIKRGEMGAAGANLAFEFEERLSVKRAEDDERDLQIAWLRTAVARLSAEHNEVVTALEMIDANRERRLDGDRDDVG